MEACDFCYVSITFGSIIYTLLGFKGLLLLCMKKFKSILKCLTWFLLCATTLSSCYTTKTGWHTTEVIVSDFPKFRAKCIGQTHNQIVTALGAPDRQLSDGAGGTILVYENTTTKSISNSIARAYDVNYSTRTYSPGVETTTQHYSKTDYVHYFINTGGVCYEVKTNLPMSHTEKKEVYGKYEKFNWGKFSAWTGGFAVVIALALMSRYLP